MLKVYQLPTTMLYNISEIKYTYIRCIYIYIYNICSWQNNCQSRSSSCIWKLHHRFYRDNDQTFHKTFPKSVSILRVKRSIETIFQFWSIWSPNQEEASLHFFKSIALHIISYPFQGTIKKFCSTAADAQNRPSDIGGNSCWRMAFFLMGLDP